MKCDICKNSNSFKNIYKKDDFNIIKCLQCGLVFREKTPDHNELKDIYSDAYFFKPSSDNKNQGYLNYIGDERFFRINSLKRIKQIQRIKKGQNLLDVGCASGFFLDEVQKFGWNVMGVEIFEKMANYGKDKFNLDIFTNFFQKFDTNQKFDVITMWDYIEHSVDPAGDINKAYSLLNSDGLLVISTGNIDSILAKICKKNWHLLTPHHHLFYFNKRTIRKLLENSGFKILKIYDTGNYYSIQYLIHKLMPYIPSVFKKTMSRIGGTRMGKFLIYINLFDIMTVYAKKL